ncbi:MAG: M81 family metallopeptidase, partial [Betaproteobacteria bacterium]|nr:M81 family metallopeptidase [Betaproteobacteria bacterium]
RYGDEALNEQRHARTAMGAFIRICEAQPDAILITPVSATANPSGTVAADAYSHLVETILEGVRQQPDAILLDLHGALVAENAADGEGELLKQIRAIAPDTPISVALDLHGNVTPAMVDNADIIVSFKTYPHIDMAETGEQAGRLVMDLLAGRTRPLTHLVQLPLLSHTLRSNTNEGAMQRAVEAARRAEQTPGVLAASVMAGFSLADFEDAGVSVIVVTDNDIELANQVANDIAAQIWRERDGFVYRSEPLAQSIARAKAIQAEPGEGPVLLLDHSDNVMSGGTCDTMDVLEAALKAQLTPILVGPICDPQAVQRLWKLRPTDVISAEIGNRIPLTQQGITKKPLRLTGVVRAKSDGEFTVSGPIYTGAKVSLGRTVLFDTLDALIVISERRMEPYDMGIFNCVGMDPSSHDYLLLKSRMYARPVFGAIAKGLVECDADQGGPTSSNYALFPFKNIRRPVYPLDPESAFHSS